MSANLLCPKCHSDQISTNKRGFSAGKAVAGVVVAGPVGALAGAHNSGKLESVCLNCGHSWDPVKKAKEEQATKERQATAEATARYNKWKNEFYAAYESGNTQKASQIAQKNRGAMLKEKGLQGVYKELKRDDTLGLIIQVVIIAFLGAIFVWFLSCVS